MSDEEHLVAPFESEDQKDAFQVLNRAMDKESLETTGYIKDDRDRGKIMMINAQLDVVKGNLDEMMKEFPEVRQEVGALMRAYENHLIGYGLGMSNRKGWRGEWVFTILSALGKKAGGRVRMSMFDDGQMRGVERAKGMLE